MVNPRTPKGYWSHTKPQGGVKTTLQKHFYDSFQALIDFFI